MNEHIEDLLYLYALGGLSAEECLTVEKYVAQNPEAKAALEELLLVTAALPFAADPLPPSPALKHDLLRRANLDAHQRLPASHATTPGRESRPGLLHWLRGQAVGLSLAGLFFALALLSGIWAVAMNQEIGRQANRIASLESDTSQLNQQVQILQQENATLKENGDSLAANNAALDSQLQTALRESADLVTANDRLTEENATLAAASEELQAAVAALNENNATLQEVVAVYQSLVSPDVAVTTLLGTEEHPEGVAQMVMTPDGKTALLVVSGLEQLPAELAYQVLLIRDDGHDTAETFLVDTTGHGVLLVNASVAIDTYTAIGVSIEPAGGSPQRTGEIVLLGSLRS
jgi:anti-sigma-K factor RskA